MNRRKVMMENIRNEKRTRRFNRKSKIEIPNNCQKCSKTFEPKNLYSYVDGNNIAITQNSGTYCKSCYAKVYGSWK